MRPPQNAPLAAAGESEVGQTMLRFHAERGGPAPTGLQMLLLFAIHSRASETAFWGPYFRFCPQSYDDPLWCANSWMYLV
jgi:hypothetical protein